MESPYSRFGKIVKELRKRLQETQSELSLTLEINEPLLIAIENGEMQPTEELVDQIISHFDLDEHSANNLWRLAGYTDMNQQEGGPVPVFVPLPELKIAYTDLVHVSINNFGIVLNFMQNGGINNQPMVVSRLGMSKEHAQSVIDVMSEAIRKSAEQDKQNQIQKKPLSLPTPKNKENNLDKSTGS